ncbi:uncharacterized protein LOC144139894 [Haemaphysalis longicornis]
MSRTPPGSPVTLHQPRTPAVFCGEAFEDVEDWLEQFEPVASFNQWNPQQQLGHVYYSLDDGARTWYENGPRLSICVLIVRDTGGGAGYDYPMQRTPSASPERPSPVHTPVHQASRRKRGLSPEYGRLDFTAPRRQASEPQVMAQALTPQVTLQQPRTPAIFHGEVFEDVEDWLEQFERVASFNQWDARQKLREVYYALEHGARTWFENREARLSTWEEFRQELLESFATTDRRDLAQRLLESRIQKPNETVTMFTEDMTRLFKRADPEMSEPRKLRYLMHGVKEQLFAGLVRNPPRTVKDFVREATAIERALQERCRQFNRVNGTSSGTAGALTSMANDTTLRDIIRSIVREELQLSGIGGLEPAPASVADVVRQEIRQALSIVEQQVQPPQASYVTALRRQLPIAHTPLPPLVPRTDPRLQRADSATYSRSQQQSSYGTQMRKTDVWRDDNNQPLHRLAARHLTVETPEDRRVEDPLALGGETNRRNLRRQGCYRQALARPSKTNYAADRRHDLADTTNDDLVDRTRSVPSRTRDLADSTQYPADGSHDVAF